MSVAHTTSALAPRPTEVDGRFGLLEWCYVAVLIQTVFLNPIIAESGTLQVYLNTLTWPVLAVAAACRWASGHDRRMNRPIAALVLAVVGVVWLIVLQTALTGFQPQTVSSLLRLLYVPVGIIAALAVYRASERVLDIAIVALGVKGLILLVGYLQGPVGLANRLAVRGLGVHNTFAAFLVILLVLRSSTWMLAGRRPASPVLLSFPVLLACVFLTFSRGAFIALMLGSASLVGLTLLAPRTGQKRSLRAALVGLLVVAPLLVSGPLQSRLTSLSLDQSSGRSEIWVPAWEGFVDAPVIGNGFGSFKVYSPLFVDPSAPSTTGTTYSAHNLPLQILYEGGLVGIVAVLTATWLVVRRCWALVMAPALVTIVVDSIFETFPYVVQVSWVLGLVFAVGLKYRHEADRTRGLESRR